MTCNTTTIRAADGTPITAIVCSRGRRSRKVQLCSTPHCNKPHTKLCDHPVVRKGKEATCDRPMCDGHAAAVGLDRDYCQAHARHAKAVPYERGLFALWAAYHWATETFDRSLSHTLEGDMARVYPEHVGKSEDFARRARRALGLHGREQQCVEKRDAERLTLEGLEKALREADGMLDRAARIVRRG